MTAASFPRQPDDPGSDTIGFVEPLVIGRKAKRHADSVERTIRRNAGFVHKHKIAATVCWSVEMLERFAAAHGIDLTYRGPEHEPRGA